jgi:hypothetical protein
MPKTTGNVVPMGLPPQPAKNSTVKRAVADLWIPLLLGLAAFLYFTGGRELWPTSFAWMMLGDGQQHFIGWNFFRHTPVNQFPLGANLAFGEKVASSIVYSDSIPLFAIPLKFLNPILPPNFQYFGAFILISFLLQAYFAWKLLLRLTRDRLLAALGTCLLVWSPIMLFRLQHNHDALMAHWVILAAIYLYLEPRFRPWRWMALIVCAVLIHAYLMGMICLLWLADSFRRVWISEMPWRVVARHAVLLLAVLYVAMWVSGYFMVAGGYGSGGFGYFRANLLAPFDPEDRWSILLPALPATGGDYEGFDYLGLGVFFLIGATLYQVVRGRRTAMPFHLMLPLLVLSLVAVVFALSNRVVFGTTELFSYPIPPFIEKTFLDPFRSSGRFLWIPTYLLGAGLLFYLSRTLPRRSAIALFATAALLQIIDLGKAGERLKEVRFDNVWTSPLRAAFWDQVPDHYKRIAFVNALIDQPGVAPLGYLASSHGMTMNGGYLSRCSDASVQEAQNDVTREILTGKFEPDTLYIFNNGELWQKAIFNPASKNQTFTVDRLRILAPGWTGPTTAIGLTPITADSLNYSMGTPIDFGPNGQSQTYASSGWSQPEEIGTWTDGDNARLVFHFTKINSPALAVDIQGRPYTAMGRLKIQRVDITANGHFLEQRGLQGDGLQEIVVPSSLITQAGNQLQLAIHFYTAATPRECGESGDGRKLGFLVRSVTVLPR